jgi:hypothetical protein
MIELVFTLHPMVHGAACPLSTPLNTEKDSIVRPLRRVFLSSIVNLVNLD